MDRPFTEEETYVGEKHVKWYSATLVTKEMQINARMRCHFAPILLVKGRNLIIPSW